MSWSEALEVLRSMAPVLGVGTAIVGALFACLQYWRTQRWKAADLASQLVGRLYEHEEMLLAITALDWGIGPLLVPKRYQGLLGRDVMTHDPALMAIALEPQLPAALVETDPATGAWTDRAIRGLIYRRCFDTLFTHLDEIYRRLRMGELVAADLSALDYWLKQIASCAYCGPKAPQEVCQPFLSDSRMSMEGVIALGMRLAAGAWTDVARRAAARRFAGGI